jgi:hypothetical protein
MLRYVGARMPRLFPPHPAVGERCRKVPLAVAPVLTYLQEMNAGGLATTIPANSPPPREWGVGANAATQGAIETAVAARVSATVQAYRAASAAAAFVTAMDECCDTSAPEWHWCYPMQVQALVDAGVATATADTPFYEDQQLGTPGPPAC